MENATGSFRSRYVKQVLKLPQYRRLLVAYSLNEIALSIAVLTLALLVYKRTGSAIGAMGFFLCSQFIPAFLSPLVVSRVQRRPPRVLLPALYLTEALMFIALAWLSRHFSLTAVLLLTTADATIAVTARATARTATVSVLAPANLLREGNAVTNTAASICFFTGPGLGGLIVAAGGTSVALLTNSGLFGLIALAVALVGNIRLPDAGGAAEGTRLRATLQYARRQPYIRRLLSLQAVALVFFTMSVPIEVVFTRHSLHTGAGGYGALLSAWGAGAVAGSAVYARWRALSSRALITIGCALLGAGLTLMAITPSIVLACVTALFAGAGNGIEAVSARTALQEQVRQRWMAMMMSLNESIYQAVPGVGIALGGLIGSLAGPRIALAVAGLGSLAITVLVWVGLGQDQPPGGLGPDLAPDAPLPEKNSPRRSLDASFRSRCAARA